MVCPKCGNNYCKLTSEKKTTGKDFSIGRALVGEMIFGADGFGFGFKNSRKTDVKAFWVCSKCGFKFEA